MPTHEYTSYSMGDDFLIPQCTCGWQGATVLRSAAAIEAYGNHRCKVAVRGAISHLEALPDLSEVALWLDAYDKMAELFLAERALKSEPESDLGRGVAAAQTAVASTEIQDDLRRFVETTVLLLEELDGDV